MKAFVAWLAGAGMKIYWRIKFARGEYLPKMAGGKYFARRFERQD